MEQGLNYEVLVVTLVGFYLRLLLKKLASALMIVVLRFIEVKDHVLM